ncbi:uncharacterized protein LOC126739352 [Anthonomus grandis grandis]|uniref:uncharacterized protein LOC126739352 n=1 Tax=Anthonomus grandis grandis TaxID=2921223 RepID=UPI002165068E|nr:uncharacterized protein LOC126739352 [Anthonomus grandis grandis]
MASNSLWYRDQLYRIVEESLEVTLVICNEELNQFTVAKIFDIFNQILPTGFVLGTGYWPFFNSTRRQCLCICGRYGIDCRHFKHDNHWIDLEIVSNDTTMPFYPKSFTLKLVNAEIDIIAFTEGVAGYNINIKLAFQNKKNERGRPKRTRDENLNINPDQIFHIAICSRYVLQNEYYPALHSVMFQPSPFFHENYGTFFPRLRQARTTSMNCYQQFNHGFFTVSIENMPHFTLIIQCVNVPLHNMYTNLVTNANLAHRLSPKQHKAAFSKAVQTENIESIEYFKYKELIGNLKPLWNDSSSCESLQSSPKKVDNILFGGFSISTPQPLLREPDMAPWEIPKATRRRNRRKAQTKLAAYGEQNKIKTIEGSNQKNDPILLPSLSYASILKSPKAQETIIKKTDFQWLDDQFPDLLKTVAIKQEKLDEEFRIAEEFIKQEEDNDVNTKLNIGSVFNNI